MNKADQRYTFRLLINTSLIVGLLSACISASIVIGWIHWRDKVSRLQSTISRYTQRVIEESFFGHFSYRLRIDQQVLAALKSATPTDLRRGEICYSYVDPPYFSHKGFARGSVLVVWIGFCPQADSIALAPEGGQKRLFIPIPKYNQKANDVLRHTSLVYSCVANITPSPLAIYWAKTSAITGTIRLNLARKGRITSAWVHPTRIASRK